MAWKAFLTYDQVLEAISKICIERYIITFELPIILTQYD